MKIVTAALGTLLISSTASLAATPGGQWQSYNYQLDGQRFSPLREITTANIDQLGEVCRVQIDGPTANEAGLIVIDDTIYTNTGTETVALDATSCALKWKYSYVPEEGRMNPLTRGLAVMDGRVFRGTPDGRLIALDAHTGKLLWKTVIGAPRLFEGTSAAPLAWGGMVFMGISGSEVGVRGRVMAYDAATGKELWRFNTVPMGDEKGAETWQRPASAKTGGGGVWGAMSLDVATGELFVPVGNPWPDIDHAYRPGTDLFTDSMVVLDARTGTLKWWYQVAPDDWRDFDMVAAPVLYRDSKIRDLMVIGGKDGYVTAVDRDTHQSVFKTPVTTIEPAPKEPTREGFKLCPGGAGGVEWNGPALDPSNNALVVGAVDMCFMVKLGETVYGKGASFGGTFGPAGAATGWITAMDAETGAIRWQYHAEKPVVSGITPTAGGVTFAGDFAGNLLIFDSKTGTLLRKWQTGGALAGGLVTYEVNGKQYVAFNSGNVARGMGFGTLGLPSVIIMSLNPGKPVLKTVAATTGGKAGKVDTANGQSVYGRICTSCHGPEGDLISDHRLSTLSVRSTLAATVAYIKKPKAPMPAMYPQLLKEQDVADVAAYMFQQLQRGEAR